ncbi:MAG TPA: nucleotidyltransferase family protein [Candidatus Dormibacteraeota bacterium]
MRGPGAEDRDPRRLIAGILLAAGLSSRFGRQKLLEPWRGEPLIRSAARRLLDAGLTPVLIVVSEEVRFDAVLAGLSVRVFRNPAPEQGISTSIGIGLRAVPAESAAAMIAVADQPYLTAEALAELIRAFEPGRIVVPRYGEHRGNPPVFDRRFFAELLALEGDHGGQAVVSAHPEAVVEISLAVGMGADVDRPEDWPGY